MGFIHKAADWISQEKARGRAYKIKRNDQKIQKLNALNKMGTVKYGLKQAAEVANNFIANQSAKDLTRAATTNTSNDAIYDWTKLYNGNPGENGSSGANQSGSTTTTTSTNGGQLGG